LSPAFQCGPYRHAHKRAFALASSLGFSSPTTAPRSVLLLVTARWGFWHSWSRVGSPLRASAFSSLPALFGFRPMRGVAAFFDVLAHSHVRLAFCSCTIFTPLFGHVITPSQFLCQLAIVDVVSALAVHFFFSRPSAAAPTLFGDVSAPHEGSKQPQQTRMKGRHFVSLEQGAVSFFCAVVFDVPREAPSLHVAPPGTPPPDTLLTTSFFAPPGDMMWSSFFFSRSFYVAS